MCKKVFFYRRRYANKKANDGSIDASIRDNINCVILIPVLFCSFSVVVVDIDLFFADVAVVSVLVR